MKLRHWQSLYCRGTGNCSTVEELEVALPESEPMESFPKQIPTLSPGRDGLNLLPRWSERAIAIDLALTFPSIYTDTRKRVYRIAFFETLFVSI
jgi:hypothetical protein